MLQLNESATYINNGSNTCTGSWPSMTVELALLVFILVSSLAGNVLIVAIFFRDKTLQTAVNYFIVNMCVSDLMLSSFNLPLRIIIKYDDNFLLVDRTPPEVLCKANSVVYGTTVLVSLFNMTLLAADRFRAIIFPMKPALFSQKKCCTAIATMWIFSTTFLVYYVIDALPENASYVSCFDLKWTPKKLRFLLIFIALTCLCMVAVTVCYLKITVFLYRQKNSLQLASEVIKKRAKRNRRIITMLIIIVILFYVVWIPFFVMLLRSFFYLPSLSCVYAWVASFILPNVYPMIIL